MKHFEWVAHKVINIIRERANECVAMYHLRTFVMIAHACSLPRKTSDMLYSLRFSYQSVSLHLHAKNNNKVAKKI